MPKIKFEDIWELSPDSPSGLRWKVDIVCRNGAVKQFRGRDAGTVLRRSGRPNELYWVVRYQGVGYKAHRIVYYLATQNPEIEALVIDHKDGNGLNNSITNLRAVTRAKNARNVRRRGKVCESGHFGVSVQYSQSGRTGVKYYRAHWRESGVKKFKLFSCESGDVEALDAALAYRARKIEELNVAGAGYADGHGT